MEHPELELIDKRSWAGFTAALLLLLGAVAVFTISAQVPNPSAAGSGPWLNSNFSDECEAPQVCAEWPDGVSDTAMVCCVDPGDIGTYRYEDCNTFITHRAL